MFTGPFLAEFGIDLAYLGLESSQIVQALIEPMAEMRRKRVLRI